MIIVSLNLTSTPMISLDEMRQLEPALINMSDKELLKIRSQLYALGQLAFDVRLRMQSVSNYPHGVVTLDPYDSTIQP